MKTLRVKLLILAGVLMLTSCGKDYLDTEPTNTTATSTIFETTENAKLAINGINKLMTRQYLSSQGFNGEGTIKMYYGNYPGNNFFLNLPTWAPIINFRYLENVTSIYNYYPWYYYYMLVGNANSVIHNIDDATGPDSDKQFIKAQAITYRAYSFFMLSQLYSNRWMDSNNGSTEGIVLRTDLSTGDQALATLGETYEQIYSDLEEAIELFTLSGKSRERNYDIDINVAYAIYARAALTREDYETAATMAANARNGYPLMSNTEYAAGFHAPTSEWIWSSWGSSDETLYFYSYHAYIAYNSSASAVRNYPKCISKELLEKVPDSDIRKELFLDPNGLEYTLANGMAGSDLDSVARERFPSLYSTATVYAYMQFKISAEDIPGVGHLNHFRSSEMVLTEAEAKYFLGDEDGARQALTELNLDSGRDPNYSTSNTGDDLLEEIKFYRSFELWGEGFDWFDMKRWGDDIVRKSPANGGNFITDLAVTIPANDPTKNKWTWMIPQRETDFNKLIGTTLPE
ncbi:RagB/SusD family nutrient uptake outer membrane protein [Perlabentimonas gracilis]|uniref:RagB/SusD family nutrient uptake outer membrane protein n=1 Tax=Perlabentimonas gracilis TaxID=2715279 RepID=UPI0014089DF6|nr:RagB/SusD family nutrient uptake outer membrane protein [Perlabentimonas gracilis]NHB67661.1 RagB/SusD family nutrient uptake outer membrane protein [Perlabentimonas gracilis]